jgi:hypothetical protein
MGMVVGLASEELIAIASHGGKENANCKMLKWEFKNPGRIAKSSTVRVICGPVILRRVSRVLGIQQVSWHPGFLVLVKLVRE